MTLLRVAIVCGLTGIASPALADLLYTQGSGTTIFDFTCFTTKHCPPHVNINSAGTEIFTSAVPGQVTGANGTFPVTQGTAANLNATVVGTGTFAVQAAQSGTWSVTAVQSTAANLNATAVQSTAANLNATVVGTGTFAVQAAQNGNWNTRTQDGSGNAITSATRGAERAMTVQVVDGSGNQVTTFGGAGGTSSNYTSAFPSAGTAVGFSDGTNMQGARVFDADSGAGAQYVLGTNLRAIANGGSVETGVAANPLQVSLANTGANSTAVKTDGSAVTQPISGGLSDGTNTAKVLAASTQAAATDKSLVVQINPNQPLMTTTPQGDFIKINGVTVSTSNGVVGTGVQRTAVSSDNSALPAWGHGATAAAVPAGATLSGARAQNAEPTAVTNGQLVAKAADLSGKQITLPYANPENFLYGLITTSMTGTTSTALTGMGAQSAGVRVYVTACTVSNAHATVGTDVVLQDGSGGSTLWTLPAAAVYGGAHTVFPTPLKTTAATALFAANVTTGASTKLSCTGYKGI